MNCSYNKWDILKKIHAEINPLLQDLAEEFELCTPMDVTEKNIDEPLSLLISYHFINEHRYINNVLDNNEITNDEPTNKSNLFDDDSPNEFKPMNDNYVDGVTQTELSPVVDSKFLSLFETQTKFSCDDAEWRTVDEITELKEILSKPNTSLPKSNIDDISSYDRKEDICKKNDFINMRSNEEVKDDLELLESIFVTNQYTTLPNINYSTMEYASFPTELAVVDTNEIAEYPILSPLDEKYSINPTCCITNDYLSEISWIDFTPSQIKNGRTLLSMGFNVDIIKFIIKKYDDIDNAQVYDVLTQLQQTHIDNPCISIESIISFYGKLDGNITIIESWMKHLDYLISLGFDEVASCDALIECDGETTAALNILTK